MGPGVTATQGEQGLALGLSTFAFTICFAVWTIFAIIGIEIKAELGLNDTQFGLLIGTPILTGSLVRLMLGIWTDQRSEEHTSELQSLMRISYAVFCLKKQNIRITLII